MIYDAQGKQIAPSGIAMNGSVSISPFPTTPAQQALMKMGSCLSGGGGQSMGGSNVSQTSAFWYSPELTTESWLLPKSRQEILKWSLPAKFPIITRSGIKNMEDVVVGDEVISRDGMWQRVSKTCKKFYTSDEDGNEWTDLDVSNILSFTMGAYHPICAIKNSKPKNKNGKFLGVNGFYKNRSRLRKFLNRNPQIVPSIDPIKFKIERKCGISDSAITWISPKMLSRGDLLVFPKFSHTYNGTYVYDLKKYFPGNTNLIKIKINENLSLDKDLAYIFGWYVAEGSTDKIRSCITFTLSYDEYREALVIKKKLKKLFPALRVTINRRKDKHTTSIMAYSNILGKFFSDICGDGCENKKIPAEVISSSKEILKSFLLAYLNGDGSLFRGVVGKRNLKLSAKTTSKTLANQLFISLSKLNILATIQEVRQSKTCTIMGRMVNQQPYIYIVSVSRSFLHLLYDLPKLTGRTLGMLEDKNNFYLPVKNVRTYKRDAWGYDIRTEDHTYASPVILLNCRIFFNLEPLIQSIITTHSMYPFSKFDIITPDKQITEFYKDVAFQKDLDLYQLIVDGSLSFWKFGEMIPFMTMEQDFEEDPISHRKLWRWKRAVLLEPELVEVKQEFFEPKPFFEMIPTEDMRKLGNANDEASAKRREGMPEVILKSLQQNKNIPLDPECVSMLYRKTDPSATRGTPIIQCCFKALIFQDKIRLAQMAIADRYHFPIEMWTLGNLEKNILPTPQDLDAMRTLINQAIQQPPFSIVVPPILKYEALSVRDKLLPVKDDYDYLMDQIFIGLGVSRTLITGEGPSFTSGKTVPLQKLIMVYKSIRDLFENWMINHFFRPLAEKNEFFMMVGGRRKLILPQISWYKSLDVEEQNEERKDYKDLHAKGFLSTKTLYSKYPNLDYETEKVELEREISTVWDKGTNRLPKELKAVAPKTTEAPEGAEELPTAAEGEIGGGGPAGPPPSPAGPAEAPAEMGIPPRAVGPTTPEPAGAPAT